MSQHGIVHESFRPDTGDAPVLSFVIPAYNEERLIVRTLDSIHTAVAERFPYEVIVVDNASSDATPQLASEHGAKVLTRSGGTIGSVRNTGVANSRGEIVVFIDADVIVTREWGQRLADVVGAMRDNPQLMTGSLCDVPDNATWIERVWFAPRRQEAHSHIGTGHMIVNRTFFDVLGGFDESLATGEDYELTQRARSRGGIIIMDHLLRVQHLGFPRTLSAFIKREIWHGSSDFRSLSALRESRVALAALLFSAMHVLAVAALIHGAPTVMAFAVFLISAICVSSAVRKYRGQPLRVILLNAVLFYFYYAARMLSALKRKGRRASRASYSL